MDVYNHATRIRIPCACYTDEYNYVSGSISNMYHVRCITCHNPSTLNLCIDPEPSTLFRVQHQWVWPTVETIK